MRIVWRNIGKCLGILVFIEEWILTSCWRWIEDLDENCIRGCDYGKVCFVIGADITLAYNMIVHRHTEATASERIGGRYRFVLLRSNHSLQWERLCMYEPGSFLGTYDCMIIKVSKSASCSSLDVHK